MVKKRENLDTNKDEIIKIKLWYLLKGTKIK